MRRLHAAQSAPGNAQYPRAGSAGGLHTVDHHGRRPRVGGALDGPHVDLHRAGIAAVAAGIVGVVAAASLAANAAGKNADHAVGGGFGGRVLPINADVAQVVHGDVACAAAFTGGRIRFLAFRVHAARAAEAFSRHPPSPDAARHARNAGANGDGRIVVQRDDPRRAAVAAVVVDGVRMGRPAVAARGLGIHTHHAGRKVAARALEHRHRGVVGQRDRAAVAARATVIVVVRRIADPTATGGAHADTHLACAAGQGKGYAAVVGQGNGMARAAVEAVIGAGLPLADDLHARCRGPGGQQQGGAVGDAQVIHAIGQQHRRIQCLAAAIAADQAPLNHAVQVLLLGVGNRQR